MSYRTSEYGGVVVKMYLDPISVNLTKAKGDGWFSGKIIWSNGSVDVHGGGEFLKHSSYPIELNYDATMQFLKEKRGYNL